MIARRLALAAQCAALAAAAACGGASASSSSDSAASADGEARPPGASPTPLAIAREVSRLELELPDVVGLSALARDERGSLWAFAERQRTAVRLEADRSTTLVQVAGIPQEVDLEGAVWLPDGRVALGTESNQAMRRSDSLFIARLHGETLQVEEERRLEYEPWDMQPLGNQGIEGLCRAGDTLVLAVESVMAEKSERLAPIALHHLGSGRFSPLAARLTTRTGKLSALACLERPGGIIDVLAIERHFEVARLIRFAIRPDDDHDEDGADFDDEDEEEVLEPVVVADLAPLLTRSENYEGLVWDGGENFQVAADNDWTHVTGPNVIVTGRLEGAIPAPAALR